VVYKEVYLCPQLTSIGRVLACFAPPTGAGEFLESNSLPPPADPAALPGVVLDHPLHQLLEDAHLPKSLEPLVDDARANSEPIPMNGLPLRARPKHVPVWPLITTRSEALGLPPRLAFFLFLGKHFLSFLHRGLGRRKMRKGVLARKLLADLLAAMIPRGAQVNAWK